jgi:TrpR-related protein YerC/YecD
MKPKHAKTSTNNQKAESDLYEAFSLIKSKEEAKLFFEDLCTPNELQAMADRWRVIPMIQKGIPYRTIYEQTGVSVTTIGRVARCLTQGSGGYNLIFDRFARKKS